MPPPRKAETNRWYRSGLFADSRSQQRADEDTQFATQFQRSPGDYLGSAPDIGRVVSHGVRELFISCEIGYALQQQLIWAAASHAGCWPPLRPPAISR
jgi:hypothetical protein